MRTILSVLLGAAGLEAKPAGSVGRAPRVAAGRPGAFVLLAAVLVGCGTGAPGSPSGDAVDAGSAAAADPSDAGDAAGGLAAASAVLEPANYQSPLVRLRRLQGENGHLHVDEIRYRASDGRLFQCSYTFGVVDASNPAAMSYEAQMLRPTIPNDERTPGCVHLAWDDTAEHIVYTTHRGNLRNPAYLSGWDISATDPEDPEEMVPAQLPVLQEPGVSYEGVDVAGGIVYVAIREDGLGVYRRDPATNVLSRIGTLGELGSTWGVRIDGERAYVTDIEGTLHIVDVADPTAPALLGSVAIGGVPKGLAVDGSTVYVAAGSEGLVVVDAADPAAPAIIGGAPTPGPAIRVAVSGGHAFVAAWTDTRAYDVSNPAEPRLIGAVRLTTDVTYPEDDGRPPVTARTMGIAADGDTVFVGNWWVLYSYRLYPKRVAPSLLLPEVANLMDAGPLAAGETAILELPVTNQGTAPLTLFNPWSTNPAVAVTPRQLRLEPGETASLMVDVTAESDARTTSLVNIWSDDPLQPVRQAFVVANQEGLGVGKPLPETRFDLTDGTEFNTADAKGKVVVLGYFATFCPVCSVHVRDSEARIWQRYKEQDVVLVAANKHDIGQMEGVAAYVEPLNITYPAGLESEETPTYDAITANYKGANPFPVDVVVGRDGIVTYIAREYDPDGLDQAIAEALAQ